MRLRLVVSLLLSLPWPLGAQTDRAFVEWARGRIVPIDPSGRAFRALDKGIADAQLIGVGESVHEAQPSSPSGSSCCRTSCGGIASRR